VVEARGRMDEPTDRSPFVGRENELGRLDRVLAHLDQGGPTVLDVTGEAGIGKSRLLAEISARARERGLTVLCGRATEYEQYSPFRPFVDAFADIDPAAERRFPALAELPPPLRGAGAPPAGPRVGGRFGLYQTTAAVLGRLGSGGLVMMLEDVHWADPASLELVDYLVRHPVRAPFLLVVSRRDQQSAAALAATLTRGADAGAVLQLALGPLAERDCVEKLARDLPASLAAELYEASDGNPLYFLALLQAHRDARPLSAPCASAGPTVFGGPDGPGLGLRALLLEELAPLSPLERRVVEAAALLGDHAAPATLGSLIGSDTEEVTEALRGLMARDLLRSGHGGRRLVLRHPLIRALIYEGIDPWRREELHRRAADALAKAGASVVEQAHHVEQSMCSWEPRGANVLIAAARQTAATSPSTSAHWLEVVLRLLPDAPEHLAARRELTLRRARALGVSGGLKESRDLLHQVMDLPEPGGYDDIRTSAVTLRVRTERKLGHHREAEALLRRELARRPGPSPVQTVGLGLELGAGAIAAARFSEVRAELVGVLATARSLGDEAGEISALILVALGEAYEGDMAAAREFAGSAAELVDALTDTDLAELSEYVCVLGWTEAFLESYLDAEVHLDRGLEIVRRAGQVYLMPHFLTVKAHVHFETCRITTALELAEQAESIARFLGAGDLLAFVLAFQSQVLVQARSPRHLDALSMAKEAVEVCNGDTWWANLAACALARAALDTGDPHRTLDVLLRAGGGSGLRRLQPTVRPGYLETLVNAALAIGDTEAAERWAERACKEAEQLDLPSQRAAALRGLAQVAAYHGDSAKAADLFTAAATQSARSGASLREAQSLLLASRYRAAAGDAADAAVMWRRGHRLSSEGGARALVKLAEDIHPAVFGTPHQPAGELAGLTSREREVADLIAGGLSTQAIADKLYVSPRTVESHISKIYRKIGASSRVALASIVTASRKESA